MKMPNQIFFKPLSAFVQFMRQDRYRYKRIVDVGAGVGETASVLNNAGLDVVAVDLHERQGPAYPIETADATRYPFTYDDVALLCRPCHGPFVSLVCDWVLDITPDMFYVGLSNNLEQDFGGDYSYEELLDGEAVGEDGERLYRVLGRWSDLNEYCRVHLNGWTEDHTSWLRSGWGGDKTRWAMGGGGYCPKSDTDEIFERMQVRWDEHLPIDPTVFLTEDVDQGWITPDGRWIPCMSRVHETILKRMFGITEGRAELTGFVRCYGEGATGARPFFTMRRDGKRLTPRQKRVLNDHGYDVHGGEWERSAE